MPQAQINLRRQPLPSHKKLPSDNFRYSGFFVAFAVVAALVFAFMMREPAAADSGEPLRVTELPQVAN